MAAAKLDGQEKLTAQIAVKKLLPGLNWLQ